MNILDDMSSIYVLYEWHAVCKQNDKWWVIYHMRRRILFTCVGYKKVSDGLTAIGLSYEWHAFVNKTINDQWFIICMPIKIIVLDIMSLKNRWVVVIEVKFYNSYFFIKHWLLNDNFIFFIYNIWLKNFILFFLNFCSNLHLVNW